ncbi:MAG: hypothetical protein LC753_06640 [Acidobacteria bacterium]|nr:hypothetical protein [Acidobacteriota bacterium]MCA1649966.1 hypothetical protein [Acidobacteriota bacterium]
MTKRSLVILTALCTVGVWLPAVNAAGQSSAQPPSRPTVRRAQPPQTGRVFVTANGGYQIEGLTFSETRRDNLYGEELSWTTDYAVEQGVQYEASAGMYIGRNSAAAVTYTLYDDGGSTAPVTARVPHPFHFNQQRDIQGESAPLEHREQVIHLSALYVLPISSRLELGIAAGPSLFMVKRSFVDAVVYDEAYPFDSATFNRTTIRDVSENQVGFHAGADISWFFTKRVGVGALVRFSRATMKFPPAGEGDALTVDLGGVQTGFGLRVRLGDRKPPPARPTPGRQPPQTTPGYASPKTAASSADDIFAVTLDATPVFVLPDATRVPLHVFPANTRFKVVREQGPWVRVEFQHPRWGRSEGFVELTKVRLVRPGAK